MPKEIVSKDEIRRIFNEGRYFERAQSGELIPVRMRNDHPDTPLAGEPKCTHSQTWYYYTRRRELVAVVHQYERPDGSIGLHGRPDPKALYIGNRAIYVPTKRPHR
jgi:hypothetical protein